MALFGQTVSDAIAIIANLPCARLSERINPQNREVSILDAIYHVVGHLREHAGQIVYATKQMTGEDLKFFKP